MWRREAGTYLGMSKADTTLSRLLNIVSKGIIGSAYICLCLSEEVEECGQDLVCARFFFSSFKCWWTDVCGSLLGRSPRGIGSLATR